MEIEKANIWVDAIDESHVNMAEFYYFENAFTDDEIKKIQEESMKVPPEVAKTGQNDTTNDGIRKSEIRWLHGNVAYTDGDNVYTGDDFVWLYKRL